MALAACRGGRLALGAGALFAFAAGWVTAAGSAEEASVCSYAPGETVGPLVEMPPSSDVLQSVDEIVRLHGLEPRRFDVKAANVANAEARVQGGARKILYNPSFLLNLAAATRSAWAGRVILAHEVAHHLDGHTLGSASPDRFSLELEADRFSGFAACRLGGTLQQAQTVFGYFESGEQPGYPPFSARLVAVAAGWQDALNQGQCPDTARNRPPAERLTRLDNTLVVTAANAEELRQRPVLAAGHVHFEDVRLEAPAPLVVVADLISFDGRSSLHGHELALIAREIEGGLVSVDGGPGENAGELLVAAVETAGSTFTARGGAGVSGSPGSDGSDGAAGGDGTDGDCAPFGEFRGSTAGAAGEDGKEGGDGGAGGNGGNGGQIALLTFTQRTVFTEVGGGSAGRGGAGGRSGRGGRGGRGGSGCFGLGGNQPDRPSGASGRDGRPGREGPAGPAGQVGRLWARAIGGVEELRTIVESMADPNELRRRLRSLALSK